MNAMENETSSLASKCLDLCQTLASQGQAFTFSLTIGSTFNFSMTTDSQDSPAPAAQGEKRKSPSTRRRDARRRKEFLRKKSQLPSSARQPVKDSTDVTLVGLDANSVEVEEEEEEDDNRSDEENAVPVNYPCVVCKVNSFPPHQVQNAKDIILRKVTHDNLDLKALIRSVLFCDLCL